MNRFLIPTRPARRPAVRHALASAALSLVAAAGSSAWAQSTAPDVQTAAAEPMISATAEPAGRTRAEVIAELECARASGELDAAVLRSYGLDLAPVRTAGPCGTERATAVAVQPQRAAAQ